MVVISSTATEVHAEGVILQLPSTKLIMDGQEVGTATLYITEHNVIWGGGVRPEGGPVPTISLLYPTISLHAVQREPIGALYMLLDFDLTLPALTPPPPLQGSGDADANAEEEDEYDPDEQAVTELRFIPENESSLEAMYAAMSQGQSLHPDPIDAANEDDEEHYTDGEEFDGDDDEQFEDAEESEATPEDAAARLRALRLENTNGHHNHENGEDELEDE